MERIKLKHNKKRNTAFLFESLTKELTKAIVAKDEKRKALVLSIIKEHFKKGTSLARELDVYKSLYESRGLPKETAERMVTEAKRIYFGLNQHNIFNDQSRIINDVNRQLGPAVFTNFMSNYKDLATIAQIFDEEIPMKSRVILEQYLVERISTEDNTQTLKPIDNLVYKEFVKKFNDKYGTALLEEQKELLTKYIASFSDGDFDFKIYLNEEISRLKSVVKNSNNLNEGTHRKDILGVIDEIKNAQINHEVIEKVLKLQGIVKEIS
jgi:hypothetical protein